MYLSSFAEKLGKAEIYGLVLVPPNYLVSSISLCDPAESRELSFYPKRVLFLFILSGISF